MTQSLIAWPATTSETAYQVLAACWSQTSSDGEPDWLPAVAAALTSAHDPSPDNTHGYLVAAVKTANDAYLQAIGERASIEQDWHHFRADVRRRAEPGRYRVPVTVYGYVDVGADNAADAIVVAEEILTDYLANHTDITADWTFAACDDVTPLADDGATA